MPRGRRNPATAQSDHAATGPLLTRRVVDPALQLVTIDESPDESFLSIRADTLGRLFVGGREALFVYEPDRGRSVWPAAALYRFPPDTWITDVAIRGDDLYVMTNAALYLFEGGRTRRENLKPRRLLWGSPVDLHVTWHGLAFGPEGDLYFSSGDPLLNFGDFQNRPDHWGHWTIYSAAGPADALHRHGRILSLPARRQRLAGRGRRHARSGGHRLRSPLEPVLQRQRPRIVGRSLLAGPAAARGAAGPFLLAARLDRRHVARAQRLARNRQRRPGPRGTGRPDVLRRQPAGQDLSRQPAGGPLGTAQGRAASGWRRAGRATGPTNSRCWRAKRRRGRWAWRSAAAGGCSRHCRTWPATSGRPSIPANW